ncbi:MAG: NADH-quinone oxidoreductase subunit L [Chloroflexota bacterium]|nr:NADH-quinone oxidoreductase subunit L [Chloroflexota bacterium]
MDLIFNSEAAEAAEHGAEALHLTPASTEQQIAILLVLLLPLAGFLLTGLVGRRLGRRPWIISITAVLISAGIATVMAFGALTADEPMRVGFTLYTWIPAGPIDVAGHIVDLNIEFGFLFDNLTAVMVIVVTWIGALVHIYSIGYMEHDASKWRFFSYLNLFMFSMLLLVMADSYLVIFGAWELVGLSSYLLIGFWYTKRAPALASKKAFLVNRVADHGFLVGIMAVLLLTGTANVLESFAGFEHVDNLVQDVVVGLLFVGAAGKSAQFPFHVWLPDAMEGPTPVSALIHAATMVNAGVYFIARTSPLFATAPETMLLVASIGIFTAILAASIALTQKDIKRVLAYSTLSQLGYMFAALGIGAWMAAIFHLMAHGFTKGLLFLGSGSVIHSVGGEQDMDKMGALHKKIPITHWTFLFAALSLSGIPFFAGFFSKDAILAESFIFGYTPVFVIGIIVAAMTGFYMFRLMGKTFYGKSHVDPEVEPKIHESPRSMTTPLILLAIPTVFMGIVVGTGLFIGGPFFGSSMIAEWLDPIFAPANEAMQLHGHEYDLIGVDGGLILASVAVAALGIAVGIWFFGFFGSRTRLDRVDAIAGRNRVTRFLYTASFNKWWFDDLNHLIFFRFGGVVANGVMWFDVKVVDGIVNGIGSATQSVGEGVRHIQTGRVQNYALGIAVGLIVIAALFILMAR